MTGFYQWSAISGQLSEMKRTNQIVQGQNRPWIAIFPLPRMGKSSVTLHVTNYGTAVARMVIGRAYLLSVKQVPKWKQAETQQEFDKGGLTLNICKEAALASTDYRSHIHRLVEFPKQDISIPDLPLINIANGDQARYVAVCVVYQGIGAANEITADEIRRKNIEDWLHETNLFHTQSLYEIEPNGQLTVWDADAYDQGQ